MVIQSKNTQNVQNTEADKTVVKQLIRDELQYFNQNYPKSETDEVIKTTINDFPSKYYVKKAKESNSYVFNEVQLKLVNLNAINKIRAYYKYALYLINNDKTFELTELSDLNIIRIWFRPQFSIMFMWSPSDHELAVRYVRDGLNQVHVNQ